MSDQAPFIPPTPEEQAIPPAPFKVFGTPSFARLFAAQVVSSLGDWIGLIAILAMAARVSESATAVGLVMTARMLPGFLLAPIGGALIDRWNRRAVMVTCDIGRAGLLALLPFFDSLPGLVLFSFLLEVLTLLWGPAKDASVPNVVPPHHIAAANSLGLVAAYGTFPVGGLIFGGLAKLAEWLGGFSALDYFSLDQESLAIWVDALTFLTSALLISRLRLPERDRPTTRRIDWTQTWRDIVDGLQFIRSHRLVRGVMLGLAGGLIGGGSMVPLGPVFAKQVLGGGSAGFGVLMTALGVGAAIGVLTLVWVQQKVPRETVFTASIVAAGAAIVLAASVSTLTPASIAVVVVGAASGAGYVTGFTVLQESVHDELRGRTFATLYTVVRFCLLLALTVGPFLANLLDRISEAAFGGEIEVAGGAIALPGVRLALWLGGTVTVLSGMAARRQMRRAHRVESTEEADDDAAEDAVDEATE